MPGPLLFSKLPNVKYDIQLQNEPKLMKNIFVSTKVVDKFANDPLSHYEYEVKDGESVFKIAELYYEDPNYWWVILFFNDIRDYLGEWPKSSAEFVNYIDSVYGSQMEAELAPYYYYTSDKKINSETYTTTKNWFDINFEDPFEEAGSITPPFNDITYRKLISYEKYSLYEYEFDENEKNRVIKLLKNDILDDFVEEFENAINIL